MSSVDAISITMLVICKLNMVPRFLQRYLTYQFYNACVINLTHD
jgi:hypothetical protein